MARELGNNDGKGGQVMGLLKLPSEILSQPFIIRLPGRDYQTLRVCSGKEVVIMVACLDFVSASPPVEPGLPLAEGSNPVQEN